MPPGELRRASDIAGRGYFSPHGHASGEGVVHFGHDVVAVADFGPLNHSCDPNLGWTSARDLVTVRTIDPDEELTVDYATAIDDPSWSMYCHCGSPRCRQLIAGDDWRIPQLQSRYADHWVPRIAQRLASLGE